MKGSALPAGPCSECMFSVSPPTHISTFELSSFQPDFRQDLTNYLLAHWVAKLFSSRLPSHVGGAYF